MDTSNSPRCITEENMSTMTCTFFNELRLTGKLCDVVISVCGTEFNAHKIILCGCSSYFRALFTSVWNNTEKRVYNIPGVTSDTMRLIIDYAYTRSVPVTEEKVEELLVAADQFCVLGIVRSCCDFLEAQICLENCIGICKFADIYFCPDLQRQAFLFILHNFKEMVASSEEFVELSLEQLCEIIEKDDLNVKQEDTVFGGHPHLDHPLPRTQAHIPLLLSKVRLGLMSADYFMSNVINNALVKENDNCKPIVIKALKAITNLNRIRPSKSSFRNTLTRPRLPYGILFAIGGWSGGSPTNIIEAYDTRADCWVKVTPEEDSPRAYHGLAYLNGFVYCVGGFDSIDYFNNVRKFNVVTRTWHEVGPMYSQRCYVSVTVMDGCIYALGGFDGHARLNTAERFEPESNQWTRIAPMAEHRSDASATTLHGKLYICGGFNGNECLSSAESYSPQTNQWSLISPMGSRRSGVGVIAYAEHIYVVGGFDGVNRLRTVEAYNPQTDTWRVVPPMCISRSNFGIEVVDDLLFVVGGFNGLTTTYNVECYDVKTNKWYNAPDISIFRSALSCCVAHGLPNMIEYIVSRDTQQQHSKES
ncbi:hypothetical protein UPYG_G00072520 [Umbra pygmaea]|uniref:BTB domain-containing protein n=1 Tax=Umbra pygmaea TaxID=75934 RepID=A0ABD0XWL1_UMBPY